VVLTIDAVSNTVCSINNGTVSFVGAGTCTIDAHQGGDVAYAPAPQVQQSFPVASAGGVTPQTITFMSAAPNNAQVGGPAYQAAATASSGLPVVLSIDSASDTVCSINNGTVSFIGAGTCTIDANQGGDATYAPAPQVQQPFPVAPAAGVTPQTIAFTSTAPLNATAGGPAYLATATASSGLPVVLTIDAVSDTVCVINSGTVSFIGAGTCTIDANQGGDATYAPAPQAQQSFAVGDGTAPTVSCVLPRQVDIVGDTVNLDLSLLFAPPPGQSLSYSGTNLPPSLSIVGSLLAGTLQASDVPGSPYAATLQATTGAASVSENVIFQVLPSGEILLRNGFDGVSSVPPCM
jgi:Ethanolamine utilization protein EutJ (predicted chaperonin)